MQVEPLSTGSGVPMQGPLLITPQVFGDDRGFFYESWNQRRFDEAVGAPHSRLITPVTDRPGHDRRYAIDPTRTSSELGWQPRHSFEEGLAATVRWYLEQQGWCKRVREQGGCSGRRLGVLAGAA